MASIDVALIVAISRNGVIGRDGDLPWRLRADLQRFKQLTMGHPLVMGRRTFESIGRALPGRDSIVLTRQPASLSLPSSTPDAHVHVVCCWEDALQVVEASARKEHLLFVIGGAAIYRLALPHAKWLYVTRVEAEIDGDVRFPEVDWSHWELQERSERPADEQNEYPHAFEVYRRKEAG